MSIVPNVVQAHGEDLPVQGARQYAVTQSPLEHLGEKGENVEAHTGLLWISVRTPAPNHL